MGETPLRTIDELLEGALADADHSEVKYKLRSARQLLEVVEMRIEEIDKAVGYEDVDDDVRKTLEELGYVDAADER